jgi:hypothetical protein
MKSVFLPRRYRAARPALMRAPMALASACIALIALALALSTGSARAEMSPVERFLAETAPARAAPVALSRPAEVEAQGVTAWQSAAFRGLSCSRCNSATQFCVLNPIRYEYACAPLGSVACISASRTHWCPSSRGCWAGRCR